MAGSLDSFSGPNYISSRSADVILSDVRPIKLKLDALRSINVLLDEFLYNLLGAAGSIATEKLKTSLLRILPTGLGKEAVLEAELELKAYWERNPSSASRYAGDTGHDFDLQWSFELLRLKCEAYTTMNDTDEDSELERRLNDRMVEAGGSYPPKPQLLAPAALYLTAILEHICEHILSSVSRVIARDSSRAVATIQDLFTALCEDDTIYGMFKTMKVYQQIESLSKVQPPRRSRSFTRNASISTTLSGELREPAPRVRKSSDATAVNAIGLQRVPSEKSRVARIISRSSSDNGDKPETASVEMRSLYSDSYNGNSPELLDSALLDEFDELMRSGSTMKVSLTPDRLKSMEVYKQEQRRRMPQNGSPKPSASPELKRGHNPRKPSLRNVDAIAEDEEPQHTILSSATSEPPPSSFQPIVPRPRQSSLSRADSSSQALNSGNSRQRSVSVSALSQPVQRSHSDTPPPPLPSSAANSPLRMHKSASARAVMGEAAGMPKRTRKIGRNRESLDLDDIMNGSDEEGIHTVASPVKPPSNRAPAKPYVSKSARELIAFLEEGPPEEPNFPNPSMVSIETKSKSGGGLKRMMSRLTLGGSRENLHGQRALMDNGPKTPKTPKSAYRMPYASSINSLPPPPSSYSPSSRHPPNVIVATPPPPPPPAPRFDTPPPSIPSSDDIAPSTTSSAARRSSIIRKAVPTFDEFGHSQASHSKEDIISPSVLRQVNGNGYAKPSSEREREVYRRDPRMRAESIVSSTTIMTDYPRSEYSENIAPVPEVPTTIVNGTVVKKVPAKLITTEPQTPLTPRPGRKDQEAQGPPGLHLSFDSVEQMRRMLTVATTADECRLLVDMFLTQNGYQEPSTEATSSTPVPLQKFTRRPEEVIYDLRSQNDDLERSLVSVLLGEDEDYQRDHLHDDFATDFSHGEVPLSLQA
ncbi:hypothetical protein K474DRAFT_1655346 [Panus rudis PR-1116 ss-1]|nr:hypothetical protein K474DRAFT_1655346 [Panus rudis PR-1116 ss-1]